MTAWGGSGCQWRLRAPGSAQGGGPERHLERGERGAGHGAAAAAQPHFLQPRAGGEHAGRDAVAAAQLHAGAARLRGVLQLPPQQLMLRAPAPSARAASASPCAVH